MLAIGLAKKNMRGNDFALGYLRTELIQGVSIFQLEEIEKRTPLRRIGEVSELIGLTVYLAIDDYRFMTRSIVKAEDGWETYGYI